MSGASPTLRDARLDLTAAVQLRAFTLMRPARSLGLRLSRYITALQCTEVEVSGWDHDSDQTVSKSERQCFMAIGYITI
jgi:hypothetical protein